MVLEEERRQVRVGERFAIDLPANPTTGYDWQVASSPQFLRFEGRTHLRSADRPGAGGTTTVTMRAVEAGEGTLILEYRRPWEPAAIEERRVHVRADPGDPSPA